jgi:protein-tyrosine phosphatase
MPEVDDGAQSLEEACAMAQIAYESGTSALVATPHYNVPGIFQNIDKIHLVNQFGKLCDSVQNSKNPIRVMLGMEVFATDDIVNKITNGDILMLNDSRYILIEFDMNDHPLHMNGLLDQIAHLGLIPVIAHPERYAFMQHEIENAFCWKTKGYIIQLNKGSIQGAFGSRIRRTTLSMLRMNLAHVIASDGHSPYQRTPDLFDIYEYVSDHFSCEYADDLLKNIPEMIINNQ